MCLVCDQDDCLYGEKCVKVKFYNTEGSATKILGRDAEWEHVIPRAVINKSSFLKGKMNYDKSIVYALDKCVHRDAIDGAGGGVSSTGRSYTSQGWADLLAPLFDDGHSDKAVNDLIIDEVHAIKTLPDKSQYMPYIASLGAVLYNYSKIDIISEEALANIYKWVASKLTENS